MLIIISGAFFYFSQRNPQQLLDLNLEAVQSSAKPGQEIVFIADILNLGSGSRYDVFLKHELIDIKSNKVVAFKQETVGIETSASKQTAILIPQDTASGNYILRTIATYSGNRAVATLQVKIEEKEEGTVIIPDTGGEEQEEEQPEEEQPEEEKEEETPEPEIEDIKENPIEGLTSYEISEEIKKIAKTDKKKAAGLCQTLALQISRDLCYNNVAEIAGDRSYCTIIQDERTKDVCLSNLARITKRSEICESISRDSRRDSCYMNFVVDFKDYSVCDKVVNQYLKQSCGSLKQLSELNQTDISFYNTLINQTLLSLRFN